MRWVNVLVVLAIGCDLDTEVDVRAQAVVGGTTSPQDRATVALVSATKVFCSGVLIEPMRVLTAAHCLPPHVDYPIEDIEVFFGVDITQGGTRIAVADARAHPTWSSDDLTGDIGIVELAEPSSVEPVELALQVSEIASVGDTLRGVGYGVSLQGEDNPGVKRSGSMVADVIDDSSIRLSADGTVTCNGDSGGPLFATGPAGEVLVGIHSRSNCDTTSLAERVDAHRDFIAGGDPVDADDDQLGAELVGGCQSTHGGDSGILLLLMVVVVLGRAVRRPRSHGSVGDDRLNLQALSPRSSASGRRGCRR